MGNLLIVLLMAGSLSAQLPKGKFDELSRYVESLPLASGDKARILKLASESVSEGQAKVNERPKRTGNEPQPTNPEVLSQQSRDLIRRLGEQQRLQPHLSDRPPDFPPNTFNNTFQRYMESQREQRQFRQEMMLQQQLNPQSWNQWQPPGLANSPSDLNNNLMNLPSSPPPAIIPAPTPQMPPLGDHVR